MSPIEGVPQSLDPLSQSFTRLSLDNRSTQPSPVEDPFFTTAMIAREQKGQKQKYRLQLDRTLKGLSFPAHVVTLITAYHEVPDWIQKPQSITPISCLTDFSLSDRSVQSSPIEDPPFDMVKAVEARREAYRLLDHTFRELKIPKQVAALIRDYQFEALDAPHWKPELRLNQSIDPVPINRLNGDGKCVVSHLSFADQAIAAFSAPLPLYAYVAMVEITKIENGRRRFFHYFCDIHTLHEKNFQVHIEGTLSKIDYFESRNGTLFEQVESCTFRKSVKKACDECTWEDPPFELMQLRGWANNAQFVDKAEHARTSLLSKIAARTSSDNPVQADTEEFLHVFELSLHQRPLSDSNDARLASIKRFIQESNTEEAGKAKIARLKELARKSAPLESAPLLHLFGSLFFSSELFTPDLSLSEKYQRDALQVAPHHLPSIIFLLDLFVYKTLSEAKNGARKNEARKLATFIQDSSESTSSNKSIACAFLALLDIEEPSFDYEQVLNQVITSQQSCKSLLGHMVLGHLHALRNENEKAIEAYRTAIGKDSFHPPFLSLGTVLLKAGKFKEAKECFEKALTLTKDSENIYTGEYRQPHLEQRELFHLGLAEARFCMRDDPKVGAQMLAKQRERAVLRVERAVSYYKKTEHPIERAEYMKWVTSMKDATNLQKLIFANLLKKASQFEEALSYFKEVQEKEAENGEAIDGIITCSFALHKKHHELYQAAMKEQHDKS